MTTDFTTSRFERAQEPPEEVVITRSVARTRGLQPEDLGVLNVLLLRDPTLPATLEAIRADLLTIGWKMGKDRFNKIIGRLKAVGHVAHLPAYDEQTQRPTWVTRVYRNPANNQHYVDLGASASLQVSAETRKTRNPEPDASAETLETRVSPGQRRNAENPQSGAESLETRNPAERVSAGQSRNAENPQSGSPPPHPPEEEDPPPPTPSSTAGPLPSQREEAAEFSEEEFTAAVNFLVGMNHWQAGAKTARRCARPLLRTMRAQGWPSLVGMDNAQRELLEADVLRNTGGAISWTKCLSGWVEDLRLYARVTQQPGESGASAGASREEVEAAIKARLARGTGL